MYHYYFGQVKFRLRDFDGYIANVNKAIELDEKVYGHTLVEAYQAVAGHYGKMEDFPKQIEFLQRCIDEEPSNATFHRSLGNAYLKQKEFAKAVDQWKLVLEINPDHPEQMTLMNLINRHQPENGKDKGAGNKGENKENPDQAGEEGKEKAAPPEPGKPEAGKEGEKDSGGQPKA